MTMLYPNPIILRCAIKGLHFSCIQAQGNLPVFLLCDSLGDNYNGMVGWNVHRSLHGHDSYI